MVETTHLSLLLSFRYSINRQLETLLILIIKYLGFQAGPFQFYNISNIVFKLHFPIPGLLSSSVVVPSCPLQTSHSLVLCYSP